MCTLLITLTSLIVRGGYHPGPCDGQMSTAPWCDQSKPFKARAAALVANLSVPEKSGMFVEAATPIRRVGWPGYNWWSESLHGVARGHTATSFPQILGLASVPEIRKPYRESARGH